MPIARFTLLSLALLLLPASAAIAQPGPGEGPDENLESIEPEAEPIQVGLAGEYPADIARFLLAQGVQDAILSPSGEYVAVQTSLTGEPQIWVVPTAGGQPRRLTFGNGVTFSHWARDGQSLFYGADSDGDEQEAYFRISLDGRSEQRILPAAPGAFRQFGAVLPENRGIVFASTERNGLDFDIYVLDLESGEQRRVFEGEYAWWPRSLSPDGQHLILTQAVGEDSNNLYLLDLASGDKRILAEPERRANTEDGGFAWTGDGQAVYHASNENREFRALVRRDLADNSVTTVVEADYDIDNIQLCGPDRRYLLWTTNEHGFFRLHGRDLTEDRALVTPDVPEGVYSLSCPDDSSLVTILINGWATPGDLVVWDLGSGSTRTVWASNLAGLDRERLVRPESILMPARDGVSLQGLLYLPHDEARVDDRLPPVVFDVHGGPTSQAMANYAGPMQYLVNRGIAVFQPNTSAVPAASATPI